MSDVLEEQPVKTPSEDLVLLADGYAHEPRWEPGERLEHLFEQRCDELREAGDADRLAVDGDIVLTFDELDLRANALARHLLQQGVCPGDRVALLFDQAAYSYVAILAVLKAHAAFVPLDAGFPADRIAYIVADAGVRTVLTLSHLKDALVQVHAEQVYVDTLAQEVSSADDRRLAAAETGEPIDELCYIIYTSGSTGRPKGVAVEHASICNFVRVAVEVYGYQGGDRVYQGMTIAFDFSVEEIWVPLLAGATLVPKPAGSALLGEELGQYLRHQRITALCCVPTLLATLEDDLPDLRFLLVSGEACPQDLITRWHRPERRFLNVYGPTETTVTATWSVVHPDRPVTLGVPLPTYAAVILDPERPRALPRGEMGEIGIAGLGLAVGYVNREDLTGKAFIPDFLQIDRNPSGRIYRTGDLGRVTPGGEIEYHGRIDTQVKIRGYRIELAEIESVLLELPGVAQAVVDTHEAEPGLVELVAYYTRRPGVADLDDQRMRAQLRSRLPAYMVPAYLEELASIPMLPSDKADRKSLPPPRSPRNGTGTSRYVAPSTGCQEALCEVFADALHLDRVSADADFFEDLGANSLLMAHVSTRARAHPGLPSLTMRDMYQHPTVARLASHLESLIAPDGGTVTASVTEPPVAPFSTRGYVVCGALQLLLFLAYAYGVASLSVRGYEWVVGAQGLLALWGRTIAFGAFTFVLLSLLPVLVKWLVVGRWTVREIPVWSLAYLRFWLVKTLTIANPMALFVGSPLYSFYLRAMGARIGKGVLILSRSVPVCTDLLTIGDGAVIGKDAHFHGYRAHAGMIQTGSVTIGRHAYVAPATVLDIDTTVGDGAQLGHTSALHAHQAIPAGERWHGSPARPAGVCVDFQRLPSTGSSAPRRALFAGMQLVNRLLIAFPLGLAALAALLPGYLGSERLDVGSWTFYRDMLLMSLVLYFGGLAVALTFVLTVPRLLARGLREGVVYRLYGWRYFLERLLTALTNVGLFLNLFGDSSLIVHYLRVLGYDVSRPIEQTGSNFGAEVKHDSPYLCTIGRGTMVSDGLSMLNTEYSDSSFRLSRTTIGAHSFFGNGVVYPPNAKVGDDCLFATKTMVPVDGEVRQGVGLLGSPAFEIPRAVRRDASFDDLASEEELPRRLSAKLRHNVTSMAIYLSLRWFHVFLTLLLLGAAGQAYSTGAGALAVAVASVVLLFFTIGYFVLAERAAQGFRPLEPLFCSIYDPRFWRHERFWKMIAPPIVMAFSGTPYKNVVMRLAGVRVGRRVFDDGCFLPEKTLVSIGDDCTLNIGTIVQCHSMEEGAFKLGGISIEHGVTLGVGAYVHYSVVMRAGSVLETDSFLMKGTEVETGTRWGGNPANLMPPGAIAAGMPPEPQPIARRRGRHRTPRHR